MKLKIKNFNKNHYIIGVLIILLGLLSYMNVLNSKNNIVNLVQSQNSTTLEGVIIHLESFFEERTQRLKSLSNILNEKKQGIEYYMENEYKEDGQYYSINYLNSEGNYIYKVPYGENYIGENVRDTYLSKDTLLLFINKAKETKEPQITDIFRIDESKLGMCIIIPVIENDQVMGFFGSTFDVEQIGRYIVYSKIQNVDNTVFGVTKDGIRSFSLNKTYLGKDVYDESVRPLTNLTKDNYNKMINGEEFKGVHDGVFNGSNPYKISEKVFKKYMVSKPVYLNNEFKFSLAVTTPASSIRILDKFVIYQITICYFVFFIMLYVIYSYIKSNEEKQKLEKSLAKTEEYNRLKTDLFCNMSHELRTPLTIMLNGIHFILTKFNKQIKQETELEKVILKIRQNAFRLLKLVNNFLEISKLDSGVTEKRFKNVNIVKTIEDVVISAVIYAKQKRIKLTFDTQIEEKIIAIDEDGMEKVVMNLLSNAIKFTNPKGKIYVNIDESDEYIKISVKDTGMGIPADKLEYIFERFTQVDSSLRRIAEGTGVGLSIVKAIVEMHEGKIEVISEEGKGSEFVVYIPNRIIEGEDISVNTKMDKEIINAINIEFSDISET